MDRKTLYGLLGVLGIVLTAGLALPFVNKLQEFTVPQLMVYRGLGTAAMVFVLLRGAVLNVDKYTYWIAVVMPFATLGLFKGSRDWGLNPTMIIIAGTPVVTLFIGLLVGRRISRASLVGLTALVGGVAMAKWGGEFTVTGLAWSLFGTTMNAVLYELFGRAKASLMQICFWACIGTGVFGVLLSTNTPWPSLMIPRLGLSVLGFVLVGGFLYWMANLVAFRNLPPLYASILAQAETPAVMAGAALLLNEHLTVFQWVGVAIALSGSTYIAYCLSK